MTPTGSGRPTAWIAAILVALALAVTAMSNVRTQDAAPGRVSTPALSEAGSVPRP